MKSLKEPGLQIRTLDRNYNLLFFLHRNPYLCESQSDEDNRIEQELRFLIKNTGFSQQINDGESNYGNYNEKNT